MKQYIFVGLLVVCTGCGGESPPPAPSPLETFDQDRLWVLMKAVGIRPNNKCVEYYREPDADWDPNFIVGDLPKICPPFAVKVATYLAHNGVAGVEPVHVQAPAFWDRLQAKVQAVSRCRKQIAAQPQPDSLRVAPTAADFPDRKARRAARREWSKQRTAWMAERTRGRVACDPYEAAAGGTWGAGLEHFGISLPEGVEFGLAIHFF